MGAMKHSFEGNKTKLPQSYVTPCHLDISTPHIYVIEIVLMHISQIKRCTYFL